jgi:hypothetical protein
MSPVNFLAASCSCSSVMCSQGSLSSTGVSASSEGVPSPSLSVPLYSLCAAMKPSIDLVPEPGSKAGQHTEVKGRA